MLKSRRKVFVIGAGGLGREALQYAADALDSDAYHIVGHLDDDPGRPDREGAELALPVLGDLASHVPDPSHAYIMAIGEPSTRAKLVSQLRTLGAHFLTIIHPLAYVASTAVVQTGCIIAPFATVGAGSRIGEFTHLHFYSSAAHDTRIGSCVSLSPYSVANGQAVLGDCVFLGTHATVNPTKRVGSHSKVTAGSIVYRDVPDRSIADGRPARSRPLWG